MKSKLHTLILLFLTISIFGKPVNENRAKSVALNFLQFKTNSNLLKNNTKLKLIYVVKSKIGNSVIEKVMFYVFNVGEVGFVIVSGDDNVIPILGYSDQGNFVSNNIPDHVNDWLNDYKNQIEFIIKNNIKATVEIKKSWESSTQYNRNNTTNRSLTNFVNPLIETRWGQSPFYNSQCPLVNGQRTLTGCNATAIAQIMKYWRYPRMGQYGNRFSYVDQASNNASTFESTFVRFNTPYQWSIMPITINEVNNEIATLMFHCGAAMSSVYGTQAESGTGASPGYWETAFERYFNYDTGCSFKVKEPYASNPNTDSDWKSMLKSELDLMMPVLYAGFNSSGADGHTFILDGYDVNNLFHFNWGWKGQYDGFFPIGALNPGSHNFSSNNFALIGIQPPGNICR